MTENRHISQEDLALYALGALSADETAAVEAHLHDCAGCREELAVMRGDLALLGLSVDQQEPPAGAYERVLQRFRMGAEGAAAAATTTAEADAATDAKTDMDEADARMRAPAGPALVPTPARRRVWPVVLPWVVAACLTAGVVKLGIDNRNLNDTVDDESALVSNLAAKASRAQQVLDVLNAPNARRITLTAAKTPPAPSAHAIYLQDRGALLFQANNLHPLPAGKTYELWVIPATGKPPIAAGTFHPDAQGYASVVLPHIPAGVPAKAFGVTVEAAGGSTAPTLPIILSGD